MHRKLRLLVLVLASLLSTVAIGAAPPAVVDAVEFYNAALDHYFISADVAEIANLDQGKPQGWQRTGGHFGVAAANTGWTGTAKVCRFYGRPEAGLDTHYYVASVLDCRAVADLIGPAWQLELDDAFEVYLPDANSGRCAADTLPVYRSWNQRVDSDHRYTTDYAVQQAMIARGYLAEGLGDPPVAMCAPIATTVGTAPANAPVCTLASANSRPGVGESTVLTASCTPVAKSFAWSDSKCSSSASTCNVFGTVAGITMYFVQGSNEVGTSAAAGVAVDWQAVAGPNSTPATPATNASCSVYTSTQYPQVGVDLVLTAACTGSPTSYAWTGCTSSGPSCRTQETSPGIKTYTVSPVSSGGIGTATSVTLAWGSGGGAAPPASSGAISCAISASASNPAVGSSLTLSANCTGAPASFTWSNCASTTATCATSSAQAGRVTYGVIASAAGAADAAASIDVDWQAGSSTPPTTQPLSCTLGASSTTALLGAPVTLTASCNGTPTQYTWTNCSSSSASCSPGAMFPGTVTYTVVVSQAGSPPVTAIANVNWQAPPPPATGAGDLCSAYGSRVMRSDLAWDSSIVHSRDVPPGFAPDGLWVVSFTVPANASGSIAGRISVAEYGDPPTMRDTTLSTTPCDFRSGVDATGANAPVARASGTSASVFMSFQAGLGSVQLVPGRTYYFNIRNWSNDLQAVSCLGSCNAIVELSPPR